MYTGLKRLGVGLSYRPEFSDAIFDYQKEIDFIEVITERLFGESEKEKLGQLLMTFPMVCHGLELSVGTAEPFDEAYLTQLYETLDHFRPIWFSEHLSMTHVGGIDIGHLAPVVFTEEIADMVCKKIRQLQERTVIPFLLENITYYFPIPGSEMTEGEFFARVLQQADCGMLLDLNNLYINANNHDYDPYEFLSMIPLDRVVEIHLAGGAILGNLYVDTHGHPVSNEVWEYLEFVCQRIPVCGIVLERDQNIPLFEDLLSELRRAREILLAS